MSENASITRRGSIFVSPIELLKKASSGLSSSTNHIRHLVSKKKRRFVKDGFDLDLSYVTPTLIAMGYPSTGAETVYRNPAPQVKAFLAKYHPHVCKVYNLCIERTYPASQIGLADAHLENHGTHDHNAMPLFCLVPFLRSAALWLDHSPEHCIAVHCKAGKGRTGMLICAYLVYSGTCATAEEALRLFGERRTTNGKGVTIPSQMRYVQYAKQLEQITGGAAAELPALRAAELRVSVSGGHGIGAASRGGGIVGSGSVDVSALDLSDAGGGGSRRQSAAPLTPLPQLRMPPLLRVESVELVNAPEFALPPATYFSLELVHRQDAALSAEVLTASPKWRAWRVYDHRDSQQAQQQQQQQGSAKSQPPRRGSLTLSRSGQASSEQQASGGGGGSGDSAAGKMYCDSLALPLVAGDVKLCITLANGKKLAHAWFHTAFVDGSVLEMRKAELDKARKNKQLPESFRVRVTFALTHLAEEEEVSQRASLDARARVSLGEGADPAVEAEEDEGEEEDDDDEVAMDSPRAS